jgi:hypothetical protein
MGADLQATGQCKQTDGSRSTSYRPVTKDKRSWAFASHQWPKVNKMVEDGGPGQPKVQGWYVRVRKLPHNAPRTPSSSPHRVRVRKLLIVTGRRRWLISPQMTLC